MTGAATGLTCRARGRGHDHVGIVVGMCASCVAQGVTYVGGAVAGLQVMAVRARRWRVRSPASDQGLSSGASGAQVDLTPVTSAPAPDAR